MKSSPQDFSYVLCPGSQPDPAHIQTYEKIYNCWREVWTQAYEELHYEKALYSDAFSRQDYIGALFYQDQCIAMSFFRWLDAKQPGFAQDSYFSNWSPEHLQKLRAQGDQIIICSFFTVHPNVRRQQMGYSAKDLMCGLLVETFLHSRANAMTGSVRINRGVNTLVEKWGAANIDRDIPTEFGANVDIVGFFKDHVRSQPLPAEKSLVEAIWHNRSTISRLHAENDLEETNIIPIKRAS